MNNDYDRPPRNPVAYGLLSLICGIIGVVIAYQLQDWAILAVFLGAVGLFIGGFSSSIAYHFPSKDRMQYVGFSAAGILASVIAFMVGLINAFA
ncbi:MAG: hypothetical protein FWC29_05755 [Methanomassiliicoccaceae archaeon]|nr:hypothetical protein [Methanomassiliicoccaceae archaeon]